MDSISFKLKESDEPYVIEFHKVDYNMLCSISRILDIENHKEPLIINVGMELYWQIGDLLCSNHWLYTPTPRKEGEYKIKINGFDLIFKRE